MKTIEKDPVKSEFKNHEEILGFIGAGRVGSALSKLFYLQGFNISSIIDKDINKARTCQKKCGAGISSTNIKEIDKKTTLIFITVPDDIIEDIALTLAELNDFSPNTIVVHTSGVLSSDVLSPLKKKKIQVCSFHPCFSFTEKFKGNLKNVPVAIEGDSKVHARLEKLARAIGASPFFISKHDKLLYHTGCTVASNYLVAIMAFVQRILRQMKQSKNIEIVLPMMHATLDNIEKMGVEHALTGPILRGDTKTIEKHLKALEKLGPELTAAYIALGRITLTITERLGQNLNTVHLIKTLFDNYDKTKEKAT